MNKELIEAINLLEKENNISKDVLLEAIENSLLTAYKNNYGRADNVKVNINRETGDFSIVAEREVVETVEDPMTQVSLAEAKLLNSKYELGDIVQFSVNSKEFGRIAVQNAKNVILQKNLKRISRRRSRRMLNVFVIMHLLDCGAEITRWNLPGITGRRCRVSRNIFVRTT